jgi:Flp pilus assembly protein TadG
MVRSPNIIKLLHDQRGGAAIWFVLCLPVLLGFAALAVDLARLNLTRVELQNAADAAALAGARSLSNTQPPPGPSDQPYNWSAATATASDVARRNIANAARIQDVLIETGYWNLQNPSLGLLHTSVPVTGDVSAIRATVTISSTQNNGPLKLFFAPILGIAERNVQASAIAMIAPVAGGKGIFPLVISKKMLDKYWDLNTRTPILNNGVAPTLKIGTVYNINGVSVLSGQWTTFKNKDSDVKSIRTLIANGNPTELSIGMNTYIQPGVEAALYNVRELPVGKDVAIFVVNDVVTNSFQPIIAIAGFHISGGNQGQKYVEGHFIDNVSIGTANPGNGNGVPYGVYTPPILVE